VYEEISYEKHGAAAVVTLNRPPTLNALTGRMQAELRHAIGQSERDPDIFGIVLTGAGRGFCSGVDMGWLAEMSAAGRRTGTSYPHLEATPGDPSLGENFAAGYTYFLTVRKPIIAAINGAAAGLGMSITLFCDLRFGCPETKFVTSFSARGLVAEHGQSWMLPRLIGPSRALDLFFSSRKVGADEAYAMGLLDRVVETEQLLDEACAYLDTLSTSTAQYSLMMMKRQVYRHLNAELGPAMSETQHWMDESLAREDFKEGVASFQESRTPRFSPI